MKLERTCGILLHPTSLPAIYGIGDMGKEAYQFIDFLVEANQKMWQILPLNLPGYGESPYQSFSAFAGNSLLISIDLLVEEGFLTEKEVFTPPDFDPDKVEFKKVREYKEKIYRIAFQRFNQSNTDFKEFVEKNEDWLEEYSFFMALKNHFHDRAWNHWDEKIAFRKPEAITYYRKLLEEEINYQKFLQHIFDKQWKQLRTYANERGIKIIGDLPLFISYDSSDAWVFPHLFELDEKGNHLFVAGVPPDYFSKTGQLWGSPHFNWDEMKKENFTWWKKRFKSLMDLVDIVRIDHFRGFEAYWEIPGNAKTAEMGRWVKAPGEQLFKTIKNELGELPFIVEDLGFITPEVVQFKKRFQFPGMKILQFSFGKKTVRRERPEGYEKNSVVYTGTHDNQTILGWYKNLIYGKNQEVLSILQKYYHLSNHLEDEEICWEFIKIAYRTNVLLVMVPLQDFLHLDNRGRMNCPGTVGGNWNWRFRHGQLTTELAKKIRTFTVKYGRGDQKV